MVVICARVVLVCPICVMLASLQGWTGPNGLAGPPLTRGTHQWRGRGKRSRTHRARSVPIPAKGPTPGPTHTGAQPQPQPCPSHRQSTQVATHGSPRDAPTAAGATLYIHADQAQCMVEWHGYTQPPRAPRDITLHAGCWVPPWRVNCARCRPARAKGSTPNPPGATTPARVEPYSSARRHSRGNRGRLRQGAVVVGRRRRVTPVAPPRLSGQGGRGRGRRGRGRRGRMGLHPTSYVDEGPGPAGDRGRASLGPSTGIGAAELPPSPVERLRGAARVAPRTLLLR